MAMVIGAMLLAAACGGGGGAADEGAAGAEDTTRAAAGSAAARTEGGAAAQPEGTRTSCGGGGDSTRAACLAFDTLMKLGHPPRTLHLVQRGGTFCVHTMPGRRPTARGESVVEVAAGRVTRVSLADTAGCGQ
ncbi:hypothetical protein [Longimicrobium sp.]|uniref:hypothetical protein n=1 Tax=Longimicrobium sp. TaxID=2029185 RepID=UPI002BF5B0BF|nr:hypothetical protein [Longimicrobium sp.]HSU16071.1 hypothetical protein [Longimicrobium sp.]